MSIRFRTLAVSAVLSILAAACQPAMRSAALTTVDTDSWTQPPRREAPSNSVTGAELRATGQPALDEALRRTRANLLRATLVGSTGKPVAVSPSVYVDGSYLGGIDALGLVPPDAVVEIRRLSPSAARDWFGAACPCAGGVLLVTSRRGR